MKYFLGVDGGGTKTHAVCTDENELVIGEGFSGPASLTATTAGAASFNLKESIRQAVTQLPAGSEIERLVIGLAGMDTPQEQELAHKVFSQVLQESTIKKIVLVNDIEIALENGSQAPNALALISGTGSNCFGHNQAGETAKTGGMDHILSDEGSGYAIGRAVLRAAVRSFDGRMRKTELEQFVCEHFRIATIAELKNKVHSPPLTKTEVAEVAQLCLRAFDQGDETAKEIFAKVVSDLAIMAKTVIARLKMESLPVECVLAGSITKISFVQSELTAHLTQTCPQIKIIVPSQAPVFGAIKLARRLP